MADLGGLDEKLGMLESSSKKGVPDGGLGSTFVTGVDASSSLGGSIIGATGS